MAISKYFKHLLILAVLMLNLAWISPLNADSPLPPVDEQPFFKRGLGGAAGLVDVFGAGAGFSTILPPEEPEVIIGKLIQSAILLIGVVFGILVIYGGYLWMTARGNEDQAKKAMDILKTAVIGFILVVAAYAITNFVVDEIISAAFTP